MLPELFPDLDLDRIPQIGGVPRFVYRQAAGQLWQYAKTLGRSDSMSLLIEELKTLQYVGLFSECWRRTLLRRQVREGASPSTDPASSLPKY